MSSLKDRTSAPKKLAADIEELKTQLAAVVATLGVLVNAINEPEAGSFTIRQFCKRHRISESQYHKLRREGRGPRTMATGSVGVRISHEADAAWVREREEEAAEAATAA
jgi:hypothetical protein